MPLPSCKGWDGERSLVNIFYYLNKHQMKPAPSCGCFLSVTQTGGKGPKSPGHTPCVQLQQGLPAPAWGVGAPWWSVPGQSRVGRPLWFQAWPADVVAGSWGHRCKTAPGAELAEVMPQPCSGGPCLALGPGP